MNRHTSKFPKIWKISVLPLVLFTLAIPLGAATDFLWKVVLFAAGLLLMVELVGVLIGMPITMVIRHWAVKIRTFMLGSARTKATPAKWQKKIGPVVLFSLVSLSSHADYSVADSMMFERQWSKNNVGMEESDKITIACDDCPMNLALNMIIPPIYNVTISSDIDPSDIEFSFEGTKPWAEILKQLMIENTLGAELIRYNNMVVITKAAGPESVGIFYTNLLGAKSSFYETKMFSVNSGDTLKQTLKRWANREGWDVIYDVDSSIRFSTNANFEGNLTEALTKLFGAMKQQGMLQSVHIYHSALNKVIRVAKTKDQ